MKYAIVFFALMLAGCSTQELSEAKQAKEQAARAKNACDGGKQSACVDYHDLLTACGQGHAAFGGLNAEDVGNCAGSVRRVRDTQY